MPIRNAVPLPFIPAGVSDALDQSSAFPGACQLLQNLTFDRLNRGAVIPRPGVTAKTTFPGFSAPGIVSVHIASGIYVYGLIATARNPGFDEPFCYNAVTGLFVTVSGITSANVPATPSTTGAWVPPTMDVISTKVVVTHPGFSGANFIGWFDVSNPNSPTWTAGNTATNALPSVPTVVKQFGGRAYYFLNNMAVFSDVLNATNINNVNFAGALTMGDTSPVVCVAGLPVNTSSVGILQSLVVFKPNSIWQILGDISNTGAGNNQPLALNQISSNVGCNSPRTAVNTPYGVFFLASDGPRVVTIASQIEYLAQSPQQEPDVVSPFALATNPSRICGAYNNGIYRICFDGNLKKQIYTFTSADYWYDLMFRRWNGPHTFDYHCASSVGNTFYLSSNNAPGILFQSDAVPSASTVYSDNSAAYQCAMVSSAMSDGGMHQSSIVESTVELEVSSVPLSYYISAYDESNNQLSIATISLQAGNQTWGTPKFGQFNWNPIVPANKVRTIPWVNPIVYQKLVLSMNITAAAGVSARTWNLRQQTLGYSNR